MEIWTPQKLKNFQVKLKIPRRGIFFKVNVLSQPNLNQKQSWCDTAMSNPPTSPQTLRPLPDNLGSWFLVCYLVVSQLEDIWKENEDDLIGRWPRKYHKNEIPLPDNLGSLFFVCSLVLTQLEDIWRENEDDPKERWPKWKMTSRSQVGMQLNFNPTRTYLKNEWRWPKWKMV